MKRKRDRLTIELDREMLKKLTIFQNKAKLVRSLLDRIFRDMPDSELMRLAIRHNLGEDITNDLIKRLVPSVPQFPENTENTNDNNTIILSSPFPEAKKEKAEKPKIKPKINIETFWKND